MKTLSTDPLVEASLITENVVPRLFFARLGSLKAGAELA